jgi:hypothetical protein
MEEYAEEVEYSVLDFVQVQSWASEANEVLRPNFGFEVSVQLSEPRHQSETKQYTAAGLDLPKGALFYPCCGSDTHTPISEFANCVESLHFADPFAPPGLPRSIAKDVELVDVPHIGSIVRSVSEPVSCMLSGKTAIVHASDGFLALWQYIPDLSVFYYCGDSPGEGGSNQRWLEPVLFHYVLSRLYDGGLIVTDGSNCGYTDDVLDIIAPWNRFMGTPPFSPATVGESFQYASRTFTYIGSLDKHSERRPVSVWCVRRAGIC